MIDLLRQADPAQGIEVDRSALRAKVDDKIGLRASLPAKAGGQYHPLLAAAIAFLLIAVLVAVAVVVRNAEPLPRPVLDFGIDDLGGLPAVDQVISLDGGGVKGVAVDGDTIWIVNSLQRRLISISALSGTISQSSEIPGYAEGVVVGGGYVWLSSYDNGGEVLRFNPAVGEVDRRVALGGAPGWSVWFHDSLWVSNEQEELHRISSAGRISSTMPGSLVGAGLGHLWIEEPNTQRIGGLNPNIPGSLPLIPARPDLATPWSVRQITEMGGRLWLMDGNFPWGTDLTSYDPNRATFGATTSITFGLHSMVEFEGQLWITSHTDHLLISLHPETGEVSRYPLPGKPGGVVVADGALWVALHQPGALLRIGRPADLTLAAPIVIDDWDRFPHRLLCTGGDRPGDPTVVMEPFDWIDYGMWSVVQAQLAQRGHTVCVNGFLEGSTSPAERAAALEEALTEANLEGPFLVVASGDGVHTARLFAKGRTDLVGMVLVEPMPLGFSALLDEVTEGAGHPPWSDLAPGEAASLAGLGDLPLTVIGHRPTSMFLTDRFIDTFGSEAAETLSDAWQEGLAFYSNLSTESRQVSVADSEMELVVWESPATIVSEILALLDAR